MDEFLRPQEVCRILSIHPRIDTLTLGHIVPDTDPIFPSLPAWGIQAIPGFCDFLKTNWIFMAERKYLNPSTGIGPNPREILEPCWICRRIKN